MFNEMIIRIAIGLDDKLDSDLTSCAIAKWGDSSQAAINQIAEAALTQLLEEGIGIQSCGSPAEEDWEFVTLSGCFRIRSGRVELSSGKVPAGTIAQTLALILKEVYYADSSRGHREEKGGETKAQ